MHKTIVYIEDDTEMIELIRLALDKRGFEIIGALGGSKGLEIIFETIPDLILLDLMMPEMDGWDVFHQIKSNESTKNIPIVIISAKAQPIDRLLGIEIAKVDDYLTKPFKIQELVDSIERQLQ
ncbi:MAG: two-component system response regulator [Chloroflexi bacterium HGW-Chloroflexi-8]|nr:MAG: two-component system response regulator [Chloroflexi bacterium HGW-Chloroflexi-8]